MKIFFIQVHELLSTPKHNLVNRLLKYQKKNPLNLACQTKH